MKALTGVRKMSIEAVVIRADGTRENLGTIAFWHQNPLRRALWRVRQFFLGRKAGIIRS